MVREVGGRGGEGRRRRKGGHSCFITLSATTVPTQEELRKFIKFACNQERIPFGNPCREGGRDTAMNVPPYPMKIAPPDGTGEQWPPPCDVVAHCSYRAVVDVHNMVLCNKCTQLIITVYTYYFC